MRHLFECWADVGRRLRKAHTIALFLDFDGTLARIADHPSHAGLPPATREVLARLGRRDLVDVCIVSGREYSTLQRVVGVPGVRCLGLYGWESGNNGMRLEPAERAALAAARRELANRLQDLPGIWIEEKLHAFAVHYRGADDAAIRRARAELRAALPPFLDSLRVTPAKKVWEVLPVSLRGKDAAVRRELMEHPADLAIYAGDDVTDECAFTAVGPGGISIHVGMRRNSLAQFRLRNPGEVCLFLERLEQEVTTTTV